MEISIDNDRPDSTIKSPIKQETANLLIQLQSGPQLKQVKPVAPIPASTSTSPSTTATAPASISISASTTIATLSANRDGDGDCEVDNVNVDKKSPIREPKERGKGSPGRKHSSGSSRGSAEPEAKKLKQHNVSSPQKGSVPASENGMQSEQNQSQEGKEEHDQNQDQQNKKSVLEVVEDENFVSKRKEAGKSPSPRKKNVDVEPGSGVDVEPEVIILDGKNTMRMTSVENGDGDDDKGVESEEREEDEVKSVDEDQMEEDEDEHVYCLACGLDMTEEEEQEGSNDNDKEGDEGKIEFDSRKYEQFLSESLHIDLLSSREEDKLRKDGSWGENQNLNFCRSCQKQIIRLYDLHESMIKAVSLYEEERDKVALNIVSTFLIHSKPVDEFPLEVHKESVTTSWKRIYTGEASKEKEIFKMVKDRENKVASRVKRFQKLKGSFRARHANALLDKKRRIQQKMTSIYFTPKPQVVRKRKQVFLRVAVPESSGASTLACPICDKVFKQEYSLTIHLRSHAAENGKLYKCSICDKVCSSRQQLMQHRKDDHSDGEKIIKCDGCEETFTSRAAFKIHVKTHVEIKSYVCEICAKDFPSSYYLKKHMVSHENVDFSVTDLFSCKTCSKTFLRSQDLNDHLRIHDNNKLFGCDFCGKGFVEEDIYKQHMLVHTGGNPYICDECGLRFSSEALLVSHLKVHRPKGHVCQECGKACRSRDGLRKHQLIHTGKKPFSCHICNIGFIERKSFDAHMVKHTGKLPYKCNYCNTDEGFKDAKDLRRHKVLKHPEFIPTDRKYSCDFCWNGFSTLEIMQEHKRKIHERYKCQHCNRVFKLGDHLRRHMYIHTGEKPYKCALCDKSFNQESNLKEHMYRHTGIRPHRCPHCPGIGYLRRMHLKEHMVKEHGTDKVPTLPMGRAAQNARKSGRHPVPTPVISGVKQEPISIDGYTVGDQPEILVSSSNPQNCIILLQSKGSY